MHSAHRHEGICWESHVLSQSRSTVYCQSHLS
uniref:Uncharacterized protein n=1 Tax=Anguilla anguilla TaxID=7936 RepID=A0A0E9Q888_ANGAN